METATGQNLAWYKERKKWEALAEQYMRSLGYVVKGSLQDKEIYSANRSSRIRLIFESNRIEDAGLSEGETKKIIDDYFPKLSSPMILERYELDQQAEKSDIEALKNQIIEFMKSENEIFATSLIGILNNELESQIPDFSIFSKIFRSFDLNKIVDGIKAAGEKNIVIKPSVKFNKSSRGLFEVAQHARALEMADLYGYVFFYARTVVQIVMKNNNVNFTNEDLASGKFSKGGDLTKNRFTKMIKEIHAVMAKDLLSAQDAVEAGEYRVDERYIAGADIKLPAPDLIPSSMENFGLNFLKWLFLSNKKPWEAAAEISYEFACIHPFPDFNGRMSRLLLDMTFRIYGIPFSIAIRGDKKGKHRYLTALRHANRGNMDSYICLILRTLVESFQEIDENLTRAGVPTLLSLLPPDPDPPKNTPQPPA